MLQLPQQLSSQQLASHLLRDEYSCRVVIVAGAVSGCGVVYRLVSEADQLTRRGAGQWLGAYE